MINERQRVAFPTVANIRKGKPRRKVKKFDKLIEVMGPDLKNKFRVEFLPGTQSIRETFHKIHGGDYVKYPSEFLTPDGYELSYIQAWIPTANVFDGWRWTNTTYNAAGMKIAEADGDHYLTKKDPLTMEYIIKDGLPYERFNPKDAIQYDRPDGTGVSLVMKAEGKLSLFLPELGEFVSFELKTTSYIDCLLIDENLRAVQAVADFLCNGVAGGVPLDIYRVEKNSPWHKDGVSRKGKQWFIQIKANELWAKSAISRMGKFALGDMTTGFLQPPTLTIPELPEQAFEDSETDMEEGEISAEDVTETMPHKNGERIWTAAQKQVLIEHGLAGNDFAARGMLGLSNLPQDATEAEVLKWGKLYREKRPDPKDANGPTSQEAAQYANEIMAKV